MFRAFLFASALVLTTSVVFAQPGRGGPGGFGFGGGGGGESFLLRNEDVQKELELLPDQIEKITKIGDKAREEMGAFFRSMGDLSREEREKKMEENREKMRKLGEDSQKEINAILLPHQQKRLKQIGTQNRMRFGGGPSGSDAIATELKLDDAQKKKLRDKAEELEKSTREKMAKVRKEAEEELLSVLTPAQRTQWKEAVGEPFELRFGGFGGGRGGRGGRDGN